MPALPREQGSFVNRQFFQEARGKLAQLLPATSKANLRAVKTVYTEDLLMDRMLKLYVNTVEQEAAVRDTVLSIDRENVCLPRVA